MNRQLIAFSMAAALLLTGCSSAASGVSSGSAASQSEEFQSSASAAQAGAFASFTTQDLDGNTVDQSVLAGKKLTVINVWATYCGPCLSEMPELGELAGEYADKGVQFIGIAMDTLNRDGSINEEQRSYAAQLTRDAGADSYLHILPSESMLAGKLGGVTAVPTTFFVDENGEEVADALVGSRSKEKWAQAIDEILQGLPA